MAFRIGQSVQAIDEVGRWEGARVKNILPDERYVVGFCGWGEDYDRCVDESEIRLSISPLDGDQGRLCCNVKLRY
ncbi:hypothetical protein HOLleu_30188 [Holothuria leucospilota]|uniref:Uncharacterized protein n=1 Tax=Holothuria leucospilota TaxID=206669 RepID=A0A9Q1BK16_HOLLE|nr:hypothetical protein HOLleu_30188 [Holothuria leucospilota]